MIKLKSNIETAIGTLVEIASYLGSGSMTPAQNMNLVTTARAELSQAKDRINMLLRAEDDGLTKRSTKQLEPTLLSLGAPDLEFKRTQEDIRETGLDAPPGRGWSVARMISIVSNGEAWIELLWSREKHSPRMAVMDEVDLERTKQVDQNGAHIEENRSDNEWTRMIVQHAWLGLGFDPGEAKAGDQAPDTAKSAKEYRARLVQVAALAVAALEAFDRRGVVPSDAAVEEEAIALYEDYRAAKPVTVGGTSMPSWELNKMPDVKEAWRASARRSLLRRGEL